MPEPHDQRLTRRSLLAGALAGAGAIALGAELGRAPLAAGRAPCALDFALDVPDGALGVGARAAAAGGWLLTDELRAPARFELLGLRWRAPRRARAELRVRRAGGRWGDWIALPRAGEHAPDGVGPIRGAEPAWVGAARRFQLRLDRPVRGLRVHFVGAAGAAPLARLAGAPTAILPRAVWAGAACDPRREPSFGTVQLAFVHHTAGANEYLPGDSAAIVRAICLYHRNVNRWHDLGYNFVIDRYGQVFEGRAGGIDQAVIGAQAEGYNSVSTGIALLGTYSAVAPSEAALGALARLIAWKLTLHGAPTDGQVTVLSRGGSSNRYPARTPVLFERVAGHRDGDATACPGDACVALLPRLRTMVAEHAATLRPPPALAKLVIALERTVVRHPEPVLARGTLTLGDGSPFRDAEIELQISGASGFRTVARGRTAADGAWSASVLLARGRILRARFAGDAQRTEAFSPEVEASVAPVAEIEVRRRRVAAGSEIVVTGSSRPRSDRADLLVYRRDRAGAYRRVVKVPVRMRGGAFTASLRLERAALYRIVARVPAGLGTRVARSEPVHVRVLRSGGASAPPGGR